MSISITQLREEFQRQYSIYISSGEFDSIDVQRLLTNDALCEGFIRAAIADHCDANTNTDSSENSGNIEACLLLIEAAFKWRRRDQINNLTVDSLAVSEGEQRASARFLTGLDRCNRPVLLIRASYYPSHWQPEQFTKARQHVAWLLDSRWLCLPASADNEQQQQITVLLDMSNCSVNLLSGGGSIEFLRFVVQACAKYYPDCFAKLLIYEMPWVLTAAWRVLRTWLNRPAQSKVAFVWQATLPDFIDLRHLPERMGGLVPESQSPLDSHSTVGARRVRIRKAVSFSSAEENLSVVDLTSYSALSNMSNSIGSKYTAVSSQQRISRGILKLRAVAISDQSEDNADENDAPAEICLATENSFVGRYLTVSPADRLDFPSSDTTDATASGAASTAGSRCFVRLVNLSSVRWVAYKVRTTAPCDYRVKPGCSIVPPNSCVSITVVRRSRNTFISPASPAVPQSSSGPLAHRLQIIAAPLVNCLDNNTSNECYKELATACLRSAKPDQLMEHRLLCRLVQSDATCSAVIANCLNFTEENTLETTKELSNRIDNLRSAIEKLSCGSFVHHSATESFRISLKIQFVYVLLLLGAVLLGWYLSSVTHASLGLQFLVPKFLSDLL